MTIGIKQCVLS